MPAVLPANPSPVPPGNCGPLPPRGAPLLALRALLLAPGLRRRDSPRCLSGAACLVAVTALALPAEAESVRGLIVLQVALVAVLAVGAAFDDLPARRLRGAGAALALTACLAATFAAGEAGERANVFVRAC
ncbi:MAG TPA: hypothetical protein VFA26_00910 [Gemmataceae bacterium]|nr:hypothetical protein [Gemmataceae bacterium]